jgi:hypothetical protein
MADGEVSDVDSVGSGSCESDINSSEADVLEVEPNELGVVLDDGVISFGSTVGTSRNKTPPAARRKLSLENWRGVT